MNNNGWLHAVTYSRVQTLHSWPKRTLFRWKRCIEGTTALLASVTDVLLSRLVTSAKQCRDPCSGPPMDSTNYWKCVSNFLSSWLGNRQCLFWQANHGTWSNPGTQVGPQNKDFGAVLQTDLTRVWFLLWCRLLLYRSKWIFVWRIVGSAENFFLFEF